MLAEIMGCQLSLGLVIVNQYGWVIYERIDFASAACLIVPLVAFYPFSKIS